MFGQQLTTAERLTKMKVRLQDEKPFWAYLVLKLMLQEDTDGQLPPWGGIGVNKKREVRYNREFIDKHSDNQLMFFLAHEVGHLVFTHLHRLGNRDPKLFNVASDIVLNNILMADGFDLPDNCLKPSNDSIQFMDVKIDNINKKTAESIYDEMLQNSDQIEEMQQYVVDYHDYNGSDGQDGEGDGQDDEGNAKSAMGKDMASEAEDWKNYMTEAYNYAKQRGQLPAGIEDVMGELLNPKLNWKYLLRRYITNVIPHDYTFTSPNLKIPGVILPGPEKESIDVVMHVDTSGSISDDELQVFMSEVLSVCNSFKNVNLTLIQADMEIQRVDKINKGNQRRIKSLQVKGRGGTSHKPVWEYINKKLNNCKILISLTDLGSDIELSDKPRYNVIWVVPKNDFDMDVPFGKKIKIDI